MRRLGGLNEMTLPARVVLNSELTEQVGEAVVMFEVLPIKDGDTLVITFVSQSSTWRQGIWLGVEGELDVNGVSADQMTIWTDTAPPAVTVKVLRTSDGLLRLYNVWDSGRGYRRESQSATSGMLKEEKDDAELYRCNDIGRNPTFDKLVFEISRKTP